MRLQKIWIIIAVFGILLWVAGLFIFTAKVVPKYSVSKKSENQFLAPAPIMISQPNPIGEIAKVAGPLMTVIGSALSFTNTILSSKQKRRGRKK